MTLISNTMLRLVVVMLNNSNVILFIRDFSVFVGADVIDTCMYKSIDQLIINSPIGVYSLCKKSYICKHEK